MNHILSQDTFDAQPITAAVVHAVVHITQERGTGRVRSFVGDISPPPVLGTKWAAASRSRKYSRHVENGAPTRRRRRSADRSPPTSSPPHRDHAYSLYNEAIQQIGLDHHGPRSPPPTQSSAKALRSPPPPRAPMSKTHAGKEKSTEGTWLRDVGVGLLVEFSWWPALLCRREASAKVFFIEATRKKRDERRGGEAGRRDEAPGGGSEEDEGGRRRECVKKCDVNTSRAKVRNSAAPEKRRACRIVAAPPPPNRLQTPMLLARDASACPLRSPKSVPLDAAQASQSKIASSREEHGAVQIKMEMKMKRDTHVDGRGGDGRMAATSRISIRFSQRNGRPQRGSREKVFEGAALFLEYATHEPMAHRAFGVNRPPPLHPASTAHGARRTAHEYLRPHPRIWSGISATSSTQRTVDETPSRRVASSSPRGREQRLSEELAHLHVRHVRSAYAAEAAYWNPFSIRADALQERYENRKREGHVPMIHMLVLAYRARLSVVEVYVS
ncbi:hypothetical protein C8F04DRAFT_1317058 [Mycena alexandri]|uniref:Uncharacterized protein n=1 Tax=Mycena alexandri TaxID=1745969 RepID=A0AAD6S3P8_9AGAR|nr:hypothetical protein C8F04DRAFT_1317058 [Mycena alexandri]